MGWLMGLEPTTTGITILKSIHLYTLSCVDIIQINQQVTLLTDFNNSHNC